MYTAHLSTKIRDKGISVNAADPGIVDSDMITMHSWVDPLANLFFRPFISSPRKGAIGAIYAASAPDTDNITGEIFTKHRHTPIPAKWRKSRQALWLQNETEKIIAVLGRKTPLLPTENIKLYKTCIFLLTRRNRLLDIVTNGNIGIII